MWWRADGDNRDGKQPPVASKSLSMRIEKLFAATTLRTPRVARRPISGPGEPVIGRSDGDERIQKPWASARRLMESAGTR
jgi:hypothetical protein